MQATQSVTNQLTQPTTTTSRIFELSIKFALDLIKSTNDPQATSYILSTTVKLTTKENVKKLAFQALIFLTLFISSAMLAKKADESKKESAKGIGIVEIAKFIDSLWTLNQKGFSIVRTWKLAKESTALACSAGADSSLMRRTANACSAMSLLSSDLTGLEVGRGVCVWLGSTCKGETLGHIGKIGEKIIDILEILEKMRKPRTA